LLAISLIRFLFIKIQFFQVIAWIALPGDLFIRAIKCCVLPLIFVTITLAVLEMLEVGKASAVGWKTGQL
jgi:Na+/H+-dicarboxylate symporter